MYRDVHTVNGILLEIIWCKITIKGLRIFKTVDSHVQSRQAWHLLQLLFTITPANTLEPMQDLRENPAQIKQYYQ